MLVRCLLFAVGAFVVPPTLGRQRPLKGGLIRNRGFFIISPPHKGINMDLYKLTVWGLVADAT